MLRYRVDHPVGAGQGLLLFSRGSRWSPRAIDVGPVGAEGWDVD